MYTLSAITLLCTLAYAQAGGLGLAGSIDSAAIIAGPSGIVKRTGLASVGPIAAPGSILTGSVLAGPGLISAGVVPSTVLAGHALGARLGLGLGLGLAGPGLVVRGLGLEGSGIEGQYVPDLTEKLYDDGSYKPGHYGP